MIDLWRALHRARGRAMIDRPKDIIGVYPDRGSQMLIQLGEALRRIAELEAALKAAEDRILALERPAQIVVAYQEPMGMVE